MTLTLEDNGRKQKKWIWITVFVMITICSSCVVMANNIPQIGPNTVVVIDADGDPIKINDYGLVINSNETGYNASNYLSVYLTNGGSRDMSVDGSTTPVEFSYTVPAGKVIYVSRSFITIEDGSVAFTPENFGAVAGPLTNGVEVSVTPSGGDKIVLELWKTNREVRACMFDFDPKFKVAGAYIGRWTLSKDLGNSEAGKPGITLRAGDKLSITIQDNLASMDWLSFNMKARTEYI